MPPCRHLRSLRLTYLVPAAASAVASSRTPMNAVAASAATPDPEPAGDRDIETIYDALGSPGPIRAPRGAPRLPTYIVLRSLLLVALLSLSLLVIVLVHLALWARTVAVHRYYISGRKVWTTLLLIELMLTASSLSGMDLRQWRTC